MGIVHWIIYSMLINYNSMLDDISGPLDSHQSVLGYTQLHNGTQLSLKGICAMGPWDGWPYHNKKTHLQWLQWWHKWGGGAWWDLNFVVYSWISGQKMEIIYWGCQWDRLWNWEYSVDNQQTEPYWIAMAFNSIWWIIMLIHVAEPGLLNTKWAIMFSTPRLADDSRF